MIDAMETIVRDYIRYKNFIRTIKEERLQLPKGNLTYRNIRGHRYCHLQFRDADGRVRNQRVPDAEIEDMQCRLERRTILWETEKQFQRCVDFLDKAFPQLRSIALSATSATQNLSVDNKYHTYKGDYVRSKSELIIANELYANKISYEYEKPLKLNGYANPFYPDFTIYTPKKKQIIFWEHCGLMSDSVYRDRWERKKHVYEQAGISEWKKNLIVTYEYQAGDLNLDDIHQRIEWLQQR